MQGRAPYKTVAVVSGGLDSVTMLYDLLAQGDTVHALGIDYGQRHRRELNGAAEICNAVGVPYQVIDLSALAKIFGPSSLTDTSVTVPEGHYADLTMKATVVPNRNMIFLSVAAGAAIARSFDRVAYAAHGGDHTIYPDCRPEFVAKLSAAVEVADWHKVSVFAPYLGLSKGEIVKRGAVLGVPFAATWSCYVGGDRHCGKCGTCVERREAFEVAGVSDPTIYA